MLVNTLHLVSGILLQNVVTNTILDVFFFLVELNLGEVVIPTPLIYSTTSLTTPTQTGYAPHQRSIHVFP